MESSFLDNMNTFSAHIAPNSDKNVTAIRCSGKISLSGDKIKFL